MRPSAAPESDHGDGAPARDRGAHSGAPISRGSTVSGALTQVPSTARTLRSRRARPDTHERPLLCGGPTPAAALVQPGRACAEPADRPVLARAGGFASVGSCRHRRPGGRRHLPLRHQLSARGRRSPGPPAPAEAGTRGATRDVGVKHETTRKQTLSPLHDTKAPQGSSLLLLLLPQGK